MQVYTEAKLLPVARQAGQYLLDHFDDLWIENSEVKIPGEVKRRFGFEE